jgi:hypothetical protein
MKFLDLGYAVNRLNAQRVSSSTVTDNPSSKSKLEIGGVVGQGPCLAINGGRIATDSLLDFRD